MLGVYEGAKTMKHVSLSIYLCSFLMFLWCAFALFFSGAPAQRQFDRRFSGDPGSLLLLGPGGGLL
jgi:hypothetical protein